MEIKIKVKNEEDLINRYADLWGKFLDLTKREVELYKLILEKHTTLMKDGVREPYVSQLVFGTDNMRETRDKMGLTHQNFNNLKMGLKKKNVIIEDNDSYRVSPMVVLDNVLTIKFV